jgi:hypothetical protein
VTGEVNIQNLHGNGPFSKAMTIMSNAKNNPSMKVSFGGTFKPIIEVEPLSIRISSWKNADTGEIVTLKTDRKDFKVTEVFFKMSNSAGDLDWKSNIPLQFTMMKPEPDAKATIADKSLVKPKSDIVQKGKETPSYRIRIAFKPFDKTERTGEFIIKTNVPEKQEVKITGVIEGLRQ